MSEIHQEHLHRTCVIVGERVWNGLTDQPWGSREILVEDGRIVEINTSVGRPKGVEVIELPEHTIVPGFIDCHVHVTNRPGMFGGTYKVSAVRRAISALSPLCDLLMNGFTTVRDVGCSNPEYVTSELKRAIHEDTIVGPRLIIAPHLLSSRAGHGDATSLIASQYQPPEFGVADGIDEIRRLVREEIRGGADWIKFATSGGFDSPTDHPLQTTWSQEEIDTVVSTAMDYGIPAATHAYGDEAIKRAIRAGVRSIEHGNLASREALDLIVESGAFLVPTQYTIVYKARNIDDESLWSYRPIYSRRKFKLYREEILDCARNVGQSEVKLAFGTDAGMFPHADNWREFPMMVSNGISEVRALKAATSVAAELLDRDDLGVLEVGRRADIIAMPGNPFENIMLTSQVDFVMRDGVIYKRPEEWHHS